MSPSPKTTQTIDYIPDLKPNKKQWSAVGEGWVGGGMRTALRRLYPDHRRFESSGLVEGSNLLDPVLFSNEISIGIM